MDISRIAVLLQSVLYLMTSSLLFFVTGDEQKQKFEPHLCTRARHVTQPVPVRQSYRRPVYRKDLQRLSYKLAYRTVFRMKVKAQITTGCCQGWEKQDADDKYCSKPMCKHQCENGKCIAPNICMCDAGFSGHRCHIELDECTGRHRCQQKCINTIGSYYCACHDGFLLADDKMSCNLCLGCTKEFQNMQKQIKNLSQKVDTLEAEKVSLQTNLTSAMTHYEEAVSAFNAKEAPTTNTSPASTTSIYGPYNERMPLDRLASLSEQISILEERMASCMCDNGGPNYYNG